MRLSAEEVKQGLLHADLEVRDMALAYFQCSFSNDPSIMLIWIEAYETYGWDQICTYNWPDRALIQTPDTVRWILERLNEPEPNSGLDALWGERNEFLSYQLAAAPLELLAPYRETLPEIPGLEEEACVEISERFSLAPMSPADAWRALEELCEEQNSVDLDDFDYEQGYRYVEAAARGGMQLREQVLAILAEKIEIADDNPKYFLQGFAADLAGRIRLDEAIPLLLDALKEDADVCGDWLSGLCADALVQIGTDEVVRTVAERFPGESEGFQVETLPVFRSIHSDAAVRAGLDLYSRIDEFEAEFYVVNSLADALLRQFDPAVIEPVRQLIIGDPKGEMTNELRKGVVALATLAGVTLPEIDEWREEVRDATIRFREILKRKPLDLESFFPRWEPVKTELLSDEVAAPEEFDDGIISFSEESLVPRQELDSRPIVRSDPKVGRNDPCPCGSGKKFKKCCMNRLQDEPKIEW